MTAAYRQRQDRAHSLSRHAPRKSAEMATAATCSTWIWMLIILLAAVFTESSVLPFSAIVGPNTLATVDTVRTNRAATKHIVKQP